MSAQILCGTLSAAPAAWARARSSDQCSTSGRPFDLQRSPSLPRRSQAVLAQASSSGQATQERASSNASSVSKRPLSTYRWPQRRPSVLDWLESCVQDAVRQLDQAPFVQLVYSERSQPLETHHVPRTATGASELWQSVAHLLKSSRPDAVVLVHRLPPFATAHACASQRSVSADHVLTGLSAHDTISQRGLQYDLSNTGSDILAGKVGDCCDDEHELNQILPFSRQHSTPLPPTGNTASGAYDHNLEQSMDYWGLIVQSKYNSQAEGCYVLKTVRNVNPVGCQCTHYTLTKLSKGSSVS